PSTRLSELGRSRLPAWTSAGAGPAGQAAPTSPLAAVSAKRQTEPAKLTKLIRGELDWIVMKCLEKDRSRRYESANALAIDLQHYLHDEPVQACPPSAWYRLRKFVRRNKGPVVAATVVAAGLLIGVAVAIWQAVRATWAEAETATALEDTERARVAEAAERRRAVVSEGKALEAAAAEGQANEQLRKALNRERDVLYLHSIALAHRL